MYLVILNYYTPSNPLLLLSVINDLFFFFFYLFFIFKGSTVIKATENSRDWYFEKNKLEMKFAVIVPLLFIAVVQSISARKGTTRRRWEIFAWLVARLTVYSTNCLFLDSCAPIAYARGIEVAIPTSVSVFCLFVLFCCCCCLFTI